MTLEPRGVWRAALVISAVVLLFLFVQFLLEDGGSVLFTLIMAWLASIAMEPAVSRLARRMPRGIATGLVMLGLLIFVVLFLALFGRLLADQLVQLVQSAPDLVDQVVAWVNRTFDMNISPATVLDQVGLGSAQIASLATNLAGGLLGIIASVLGAFFSMFTFGLFTFYFSADAPRLRRWIARLVPPRSQEVFITVWDLAVAKTGGYVSARIILAALNGGTTAIFLMIIGMPYWLPLGIWTGVVAQFVPTIGTYIAIALPVLIGLLSPDPIDGVLALIWALIYQQIENLTLEPRISARAVDVHPAMSFAAVMLGAALFGVAGALVAVPIAALILALFEIYSHKYDLIPSLAAREQAEAAREDTYEQAVRDRELAAGYGDRETS